jgi:hypothetical protein
MACFKQLPQNLHGGSQCVLIHIPINKLGDVNKSWGCTPQSFGSERVQMWTFVIAGMDI